MDYPSIPGGSAPQPTGGDAVPEAVNPSRSEASGWYDSASSEEMVRGEVSPDRGGPEPGMGHEGSPPGQPDAPPGEPSSMLSAQREYGEIRAPEGATLDTGMIDKAKFILDGAAAGHFDHNVQMQRLVDLSHEMTKAVQMEAQKEQRRYWSTLNDTWKQQLREDREIGGHRLEGNLRAAKSVIEQFSGTREQRNELMKYVDASGMGNHPEFARFLVNVAKALNPNEDFSVAARTPANFGQRSSGGRGWYNSGGDR